jgi:hypothetical protein
MTSEARKPEYVNAFGAWYKRHGALAP